MHSETESQKQSFARPGHDVEVRLTEFRLNDLIADVCCGFAHVSVHEIDIEINRRLKQIVLALNLDRTALAQFDSRDRSFSFSHGWARHHALAVHRPLHPEMLFPWLREKISAGETIVFSSPNELPAEAAQDIHNLEHYGAQSNVIIPIKSARVVIGAVGFGTIRRKRQWPRELVRQLEALAQIFGCALDRKRTAIETRRLHNELEYLSRINTLGMLAAALAHELNQPLAAILSNAEAIQSMLRSDRPDIKEINAATADIVQDAERAGANIGRLSSLFRRQKIKRALLDPGDVIAEVGRLVQGEARIRDVSFRFEVGQAVPKVSCDRVQLEQAVLNLVMNALDAVGAVADGPRDVSLGVVSADGGSVVIAVRDSGPGIAAGARGRIFEPFFTTKPNGTGIGLSITKAIIERHHGQLSVRSDSDRGVTFQIALPAASESS